MAGDFEIVPPQPDTSNKSADIQFDSTEQVTAHAPALFHQIITTLVGTGRNSNIAPFMIVFLTFPRSLTDLPDALRYVEQHVPRLAVTIFLNTVSDTAFTDEESRSEILPT